MLEEYLEESSSAPRPGEVWVWAKHGDISRFEGRTIPVDGRRYRCDGRILIGDVTQLRARFTLDTRTLRLIDRESVLFFFENRWHRLDSRQLIATLGVEEEEFPISWLPDRELDCASPGPYRLSAT